MPLHGIAIDCPPLVERGSAFAMTVRLSTSGCGAQERLEVHARLSTLGRFAHTIEPEHASVLSAREIPAVPYVVHVPEALPPHYYHIKVVIASLHGFAFAARPVFVA